MVAGKALELVAIGHVLWSGVESSGSIANGGRANMVPQPGFAILAGKFGTRSEASDDHQIGAGH